MEDLIEKVRSDYGRLCEEVFGSVMSGIEADEVNFEGHYGMVHLNSVIAAGSLRHFGRDAQVLCQQQFEFATPHSGWTATNLLIRAERVGYLMIIEHCHCIESEDNHYCRIILAPLNEPAVAKRLVSDYRRMVSMRIQALRSEEAKHEAVLEEAADVLLNL